MSNYINISYDKQDGSIITERKIVPTNIPDDYISAIEVTDLSDSDIADIKESLKLYNSYVKLYKTNMFNFKDWLDHTSQDNISSNLKYKRFKLDKTEFI